jgi:hypothetical protein
MKRATREERKTIDPFYSFEVEDDAAELSETLAQWAKDHAMVLREYQPTEIPGLSPRQWEIARTLVQLAKAIGNERRIREAIKALFTRAVDRPDAKVLLYRSIFALIDRTGVDKLTTRMVLAQLAEDGIAVPGNSGKGLSAVLSEDGIAPTYLRIDKPEHPAFVPGKATHRGYYRHMFDDAFVRYLAPDDDED